MEVAALERAIEQDRAAGDLPFLVVGTGGSVSTGAVDPLREIAALCHAQNLWFHVDGAYGGIRGRGAGSARRTCARSPRRTRSRWIRTSGSTRRSRRAARWCANREHHCGAFAYHPPYYHFARKTSNFVDYGPQNSRGLPRAQGVARRCVRPGARATGR